MTENETENENEKPRSSSDKYIPPPMDPYVTYQTPYERRQEHRNPFIEFRRFADKQLASMFEGLSGLALPQMSTMAEERKKFQERFERDMQALADQRQDLHEDIRRTIENATAGLADKAQNASPEKLKQSSINGAPNAAPSVEGILPPGWVQATTSDGKEYFIEQATGTATKEIPTEATNAVPYSCETKTAWNERPYHVNHSDQTATWNCTRIPQPTQQTQYASERSAEERAQKWRRGFRNCPELKTLSDETELDVYEKLDEMQQKDLAQLSRQINDRRGRWKRGFNNCPELRNLNDGTELAMYEAQHEQNTEATDRTEACPWKESNGGSNWWPTLGHDGLQMARQISLPTASTAPKNGSGVHPDAALEQYQTQLMLLAQQIRERELPEVSQHDQNANGSGAGNPMPGLTKHSHASAVRTTDENGHFVQHNPFMAHLMNRPARYTFEPPTAEELANAIDDLGVDDFWAGDDDYHENEDDLGNNAHIGHDEEMERYWGIGDKALQDYQTQHMLLEQQIKKRRSEMARRELQESHTKGEPSEVQQKDKGFHNEDTEQRSSTFDSTSTQSANDEAKSSIVSTMTRTISRTLPDGSVETKRMLKKRFADGREESEESTDISQAARATKQQSETPGWFWN